MLLKKGFTNDDMLDILVSLVEFIDACEIHNITFVNDRIELKRILELKDELIELLSLPNIRVKLNI